MSNENAAEKSDDTTESTKPVDKTLVYRFVDADPEEDIAAGRKKTKLDDEKTFMYSYETEDGRKLEGRFACKRMDLGRLARMGVIKAQLLGGQPAIEVIYDQLAELTAYCEVALIEVPEWWKPATFREYGILQRLYDYVRAWENSFRKRPVG